MNAEEGSARSAVENGLKNQGGLVKEKTYKCR
jgi:hypothetical protein